MYVQSRVPTSTIIEYLFYALLRQLREYELVPQRGSQPLFLVLVRHDLFLAWATLLILQGITLPPV